MDGPGASAWLQHLLHLKIEMRRLDKVPADHRLLEVVRGLVGLVMLVLVPGGVLIATLRAATAATAATLRRHLRGTQLTLSLLGAVHRW